MRFNEVGLKIEKIFVRLRKETEVEWSMKGLEYIGLINKRI